MGNILKIQKTYKKEILDIENMHDADTECPSLTELQYIAISGGSSNGMVYVGAYKSLWEHGVIEKLRGAVGTSIGSLFALLCVLNYDPKCLIERIIALDTKTLADSDVVLVKKIENFVTNWGVSTGVALTEFVEMILDETCGDKKITFRNLYDKTKKHLKITVFNVTKVTTEYWDHENHPDMCISTAVRASTAVPLLFEPLRVGDQIYVDGGVGDVFPFEAFDPAKCETFGLMVFDAIDHKTPSLVDRVDITTMEQYMFAVYLGMSTTNFRLKHRGTDWCKRTIALYGPNKSTWDFSFTTEEKINVITGGYIGTNDQVRYFASHGIFPQ